jgi:hypothetical protein
MLLLASQLPAQVAAGAEAAPPAMGPVGHFDDLNWKARHVSQLLEALSGPSIWCCSVIHHGELRIEGTLTATQTAGETGESFRSLSSSRRFSEVYPLAPQGSPRPSS